MRRIKIKEFSNICAQILGTDRWILIGCDGDTGEGKSCLTSQLSKEVSKETKIRFSYENNMTYKREELRKWIDGDVKGKGRKPEKSVVLADEIISMFFKRNWFDAEQINGIELLNKCRDRHLCVIGNIPNIWDCDSALLSQLTFRIHIHERGRAWVFKKDPNPFVTDKWHRKENEKIFRKQKNPYNCIGFVCEIIFPDWTPSEKNKYYEIRNNKRVRTESQRVEKYTYIKKQRNSLIRYASTMTEPANTKTLAELTGLTPNMITLVKSGVVQ
jgi:hypothetical protein